MRASPIPPFSRQIIMVGPLPRDGQHRFGGSIAKNRFMQFVTRSCSCRVLAPQNTAANIRAKYQNTVSALPLSGLGVRVISGLYPALPAQLCLPSYGLHWVGYIKPG